MQKSNEKRNENEIRHGRYLADSNTEEIWGWGTPAGRLRAKRRATLIIQESGIHSGLNVLEIGCGTGLFTSFFAGTGCSITAVDISPDLIAKAKNRKINSAKVNFIEKPFEDLYQSGPFDAIIGSSILHHLDVVPSLRKMFAMLKPNARIAFAEPNLLNPQVYFERRLSHWPIFSYTSPDETAFIRWHLHECLASIGFNKINIVPFDWLHPKTPKFFIPLIKTAGRFMESVPGIREFSGSLLISAQKPQYFS